MRERLSLRVPEREGCQNCVHSGCGSVVLVDEAAEAIAAVDIAAER